MLKDRLYLRSFVNGVFLSREKFYSKQKFNPSLASEAVLSEREKEVLMLVLMEFAATEITSKIFSSARTVWKLDKRQAWKGSALKEILWDSFHEEQAS
jgi:hypothetical protein